MRPQSALALGLALFPFLITARSPIPCKDDKDCSGENDVCVIPEGGQGTCAPSCTLTSNTRPCRFGQACKALPQISIMQTGYCPEPPPCNLIGIPCRTIPPARWCIDDPRDTCDPAHSGGKKCPGICAVQRSPPTPALPTKATPPTTTLLTKTSTTSTKPVPPPATSSSPAGQFCGGIAGFPCPSGYICQDKPNDGCDPKNGGADCAGVCVKARYCDSRGLPPCLAGEECVHEPGCDGANDCPGICTKV